MNGYQFLVAVTASCGGLLFGYEIGVMNVVLVMDAFRVYFKLYDWDGSMVNNKERDVSKDYTIDKTPMYRRVIENDNKPFLEGFITSSFLLGALFGAILSSLIANKYSSQRIIMISALGFSFGSFIQSRSFQSYIFLSLGRAISGLAVGCISVLCPTYLAEIAPAQIRNAVISCYQIMIALGIVIATVVNGIIWYTTNVRPDVNGQDVSIDNGEWRLAFLLQLIPGLFLALLTYFLPNSPRWLCLQSKDKDALKILAKLNDSSITDDLVREELRAIQDSITFANITGKSSYKELFKRNQRRCTYITFFLQFFQQWTGINSILYYQSQLYGGVGFSRIMSTVTLPIINNIINFFASLVGMWNVQRIGRKTLIISGSIILLLLNVVLTTSSKHTLDHLVPLGPFTGDCGGDSDNLSYYSPVLKETFYVNNCHRLTYYCTDNHNVISYDTEDNRYNNEVLDVVCHHVDQLRYGKGNIRRFIFVVSIFLFTFVYSSTWGPVPKVYQAEVFPLRLRVKGTTFSTVSHFITSWVVVLITPGLIKMWGLKFFMLFTATCFVALIFTIVCCIESMGLSKEEIEDEMMPLKV